MFVRHIMRPYFCFINNWICVLFFDHILLSAFIQQRINIVCFYIKRKAGHYVVEIIDLKKSYGSLNVLNGINLTIKSGEIFGIIGKSGSGKTTLLNCLNQLEKYDSGNILLNGSSAPHKKGRAVLEYRRNIGTIFQQFSLMERRNVFRNIALPMECWKYSKNDINDRAQELAQLVDIEDKLLSKPRTLSGGQRQRVAIARALTLNPALLLCDEATSALDPNTTRSILSLLRKINEELNLTLVIVTHEMDVIRQICHRVAVLEDGLIAICGDTQEVFLKQPPSLKSLLGWTSQNFPTDSFVVRLLFRNTEKDNYFIPVMAKKTDINFSIISSHQEEFRDSMITAAVLSFERKDRGIAEEYIKSTGMSWEVLFDGK